MLQFCLSLKQHNVFGNPPPQIQITGFCNRLSDAVKHYVLTTHKTPHFVMMSSLEVHVHAQAFLLCDSQNSQKPRKQPRTIKQAAVT